MRRPFHVHARRAALVAACATSLAGAPGWAGGEASGIAAKRGERLFLHCRACHSLGAETAGKVGPPLVGLFGRKAGTYPGFRYTAALTASGLVWDETTLDRWLERPSTVVPGTAMLYAGMPKPEDRRVLIDYLRTTTQPAP